MCAHYFLYFHPEHSDNNPTLAPLENTTATMSEEDRKITGESKAMMRKFDRFSTSILKTLMNVRFPILTNIINLSVNQ